MQVSPHKERAMTSLLDKSAFSFAVSLVLALASGALVQPNLSVTVGAVLLALVCASCALYLLRHYNFWYSWLWWLPVLPAFFIVVEPMRTGVISIAAVVHGLTLASTLMFGVFWYFRDGLRKWVS